MVPIRTIRFVVSLVLMATDHAVCDHNRGTLVMEYIGNFTRAKASVLIVLQLFCDNYSVMPILLPYASLHSPFPPEFHFRASSSKPLELPEPLFVIYPPISQRFIKTLLGSDATFYVDERRLSHVLWFRSCHQLYSLIPL